MEGQIQENIVTQIIDVQGLEEEPEKLEKLLELPVGCIRQGGLVAFPTETVYGLGADGLNPEAAGKIYTAKGRPSDNPLIIHIAELDGMEKLAYANEKAYMLAHAFWPGPLTIILPKRECVPHETTGDLDTVAIRMPAHPAALELIRQSGCFIAAPSANVSGRPSPTKAAHVVEDMKGRIEYIIDGGPVGIGIESTIVDITGEIPTILRPGFITKNMLEEIVGEVRMDPALERPAEGLRPKAPGMKYTHYAPKGELTLVEGKGVDAGNDGQQAVVETICLSAQERRKAGFRVGIMAPEETISCYENMADVVLCVGKRKKQETVAAGLYGILREFDAADVQYIYAESFRGVGISEAIMNRLLKAAGHRVIRV